MALAGWHFQFLHPAVLAVTVSYYVTLSLLWMVCAVVTIDGRRWRIPILFAAGGGAFVLLRTAGAGALAANLGAAYTALLAGAAFAAVDHLSSFHVWT